MEGLLLELYLNNSNLMYALAKENTNVGNVRETFFLNQFKGLHEVNLSEVADFVVDNAYTFEVGGKTKQKANRKYRAGLSCQRWYRNRFGKYYSGLAFWLYALKNQNQ